MTHRAPSGASFRGKRIGVVLGGLSAERDVSLRSGAAMAAALQRLGCRVATFDADRGLAESLARNEVELAVLALHGPLGEDGTVQGLLELLGIPYTGSGVLASALAMHKAAAKKIFAFHGLPTPAFEVLSARDAGKPEAETLIGMQPPFVVKPCEGGSSIGTGIVREPAQLGGALRAAAKADGGDILVEAYVRGRELTVGVLNAHALPAIEVIAKTGFYDYEAKYNSEGATRYIDRPDLGAELHAHLQSLAVRAYSALGCAGAARVDFIVTPAGEPFILEINTLPGMTETSLLPMAARQAGMSFDELVEAIVSAAALHKHAAGGAQ